MSYISSFGSGSTPSGGVSTLTGNTGGAVSPTGNNINLVGSGGVTVTGNPGTSTLTITGGSSITLPNHSVGLGTGVAGLNSVGPNSVSGIALVSQGSSADPAFSTVVVAGGGTGVTSFTQNQVIIAGSTTTGNLQQVSGSSGLPLVSTGASTVPNYTALTVGGGGTGLTTSSPYTVVCGGSTPTGALQNVSGVGSSGQILTSNGASALPTWQANNGIPNLTQYAVALGTGSPGLTSVGPNATSGIALVSQGSGANPAFSTVVVAGGGTGLTSTSAYSIICGGTTSTGVLQNVAGLGSSGQVLTSSGSGSLPTWQTSNIPFSYTNVNSSPYVVLSTDYYLSVDCSGGAITLQFPNAATASQSFIVKDRTGNAATNNITITTVSGSVNIDGANNFSINSAYQSANLVGNGTTYEIW